MMQRWKPVYKKCDCVIDTTYGRTENLIDSIHETLAREGVEFKKRRPMGVEQHEKYCDSNERR